MYLKIAEYSCRYTIKSKIYTLNYALKSKYIGVMTLQNIAY